MQYTFSKSLRKYSPHQIKLFCYRPLQLYVPRSEDNQVQIRQCGFTIESIGFSGKIPLPCLIAQFMYDPNILYFYSNGELQRYCRGYSHQSCGSTYKSIWRISLFNFGEQGIYSIHDDTFNYVTVKFISVSRLKIVFYRIQ